jgi:hypothetical protein
MSRTACIIIAVIFYNSCSSNFMADSGKSTPSTSNVEIYSPPTPFITRPKSIKQWSSEPRCSPPNNVGMKQEYFQFGPIYTHPQAPTEAPNPLCLLASSPSCLSLAHITCISTLYLFGMPFCNRTEEFRQSAQEFSSRVPDSKRRKVDVSRRSGQAEEDAFARQYLTEAYTIVSTST